MSKVILITGASSGLGKAIAERLAADGGRVFAAMRDKTGKNADAAAALERAGIVPVEIDVTDDVSVVAGVALVIAQAGRIDVLVNGAGVMPGGITEAFAVAQLQQVLETNVVGPFRMMKAVLPHMRAAKSGLLINVTSIGGRMATPGSGLYAASKWGLEGMAESIGYEVSKLGIDSVILEPSLYLTELKAKGFEPEDVDVLAGYAALSDMSARVSGRFRPAVAASGVSTDPRTLADHLAAIIAMAPGTRPIRTTVGFDTGTQELNDAVAPIQRRYLEFMGLADMERVVRG